jgi:hypothetical protein
LIACALAALAGCNAGDDGTSRPRPTATATIAFPSPTQTAEPTATVAAPTPTSTAIATSTATPSETFTPPATPTATPTLTPEPAVGPWQRTESRAPCGDFALLRRPLFGDLHIHTSYSADASIYGTDAVPSDAYDFARGAPILVSDELEQQTRSVTIERPLDFAAVTDHSEFFGEVRLCLTPGSPVYDVLACQLLRQYEDPDDRFPVTIAWLFPAGIPDPPASLPLCADNDVDCDAAAVSAWIDIQAAANGAYDRTPACAFTTFIGYEHTNSPLGKHLHRNVIFRNEHVPRFASSHLETAADGFPQGLWKAIERDCLNAGTGCDAVIIPHNSNLSGGLQFPDPIDAAEAKRRQDMEPLVEIFQIKAGSECRFDRLAGIGTDTEDELCSFEQRLNADETPGSMPLPADQYPRRNMVRNTLKDGLALEETLGVNPFQFGFTGSTDNHNATSGNTDETNWEGGGGNSDATPERRISDIRDNPGGLVVAWAEENSRDAIFSALRRRETYATSGVRPVLRFFAGSLDGVACDDPTLVEDAYRSASPMGGVIGPVRGDASPRFAVFAAKDPGTAEAPGTDLQRAQIVKGWVDAQGRTHERVFDVAGNADNGAGVDPSTCQPIGAGAGELCTVWEDPEFNRSERAFYYVRLLENPTCRWSTLECKREGVDPFSPDCATQAAAAGEGFARCCTKEDEDPFLSALIQERAWSSPVWYEPEAIAGVEGSIDFDMDGTLDDLELSVRIGALPADLDPTSSALVVRVADDDTIFEANVPSGSLRPSDTPGRFTVRVPGGFEAIVLEIGTDHQATLDLRINSTDLSSAARTSHILTVSVEIGTYSSSHERLWKLDGNRLAVAD